MVAPNLVKTLTAEKQKTEAAEKKAEAAAKARPATRGTRLYKLKSPFYAPNGILYEAGVREIPEDVQPPSSAQRLNRQESDEDDDE